MQVIQNCRRPSRPLLHRLSRPPPACHSEDRPPCAPGPTLSSRGACALRGEGSAFTAACAPHACCYSAPLVLRCHSEVRSRLLRRRGICFCIVTTPHAILFRNASDGAIVYRLTGINQEE